MSRLMSVLRPLRPAPFRAGRTLMRCIATGTNMNCKLLVAHILIKDAAKATAVIEDLERQLAGGSSFTELAEKHSECPSSKRGGQLGWLQRGTYLPEFEDAVFGATVGKYVRATTAVGQHLIHVLEKKEQVDVQEMSVVELQEVLNNPALSEDVQFIDVREDWEFRTSKLPLFKLFPLSRASEWRATLSTDLDPSKETLVLCHHGIRSMQMANLLVSEGFKDVKNITGGIHEYSSNADPTVPTY